MTGFYGGAKWNLNGLTDYEECPDSFVYFGLTCVNFHDGVQAMTFNDAEIFCQGDEIIYFPTHQYQHYVFAVGIKEKGGISSLWIGMKRIDGRWYQNNGLEVEPHKMNWAKNEPSTTDECVIADSNLE